MDRRFDVFISYSHDDRKVAEGLCGFLEKNGLRCFIDYRDIPRSAFWARIIPPAIRDSGMMVAVFSDNYNRSYQVERELSIADKYGIQILPFRINDVPYEGLKSYYFEAINWIDAFPDPEAVFGKLLEDVQYLKKNSDNWQKGRSSMLSSHSLNPDDYLKLHGNAQEEDNAIFENDDEYEDDYVEGVDAAKHHEYADAIDLLLAPALANYKDAGMYIFWYLHKDLISLFPKNKWAYIKQQADKDNAFAQAMMARYYASVEYNPNMMFEYAMRSARKGNFYGQYLIAHCYYLGFGVEKDDDKAIEILKDLSKKDFAPAILRLGRDHLFGFAQKKNVRRAKRLLERGQELGHAECIDQIGSSLIDGDLGEMDLEQGRKLAVQALQMGYPNAFETLCHSYLFDYTAQTQIANSDNVKKSLEIANYAVKCGNPLGYNLLGFIYSNCAEILGLKDGGKLSIKWLTRAAEMGNVSAMSTLGCNYYYIHDVEEQNIDLAWKWYKRSAQGNDSVAEYSLGEMCYDGNCRDGELPKDCIVHYENALFLAGYGGWLAAERLAKFYGTEEFLDGFPFVTIDFEEIEGVTPNEHKLLDVLSKGAEYGSGECGYLLGCALTDPRRSYSNEIEGITVLENAIKNGNYYAAVRLYELYSKGVGVAKDSEKAMEYLELAKEHLSENEMKKYTSIRLRSTSNYFDLGSEHYHIFSISQNPIRKGEALAKAIYYMHRAKNSKSELSRAAESMLSTLIPQVPVLFHNLLNMRDRSAVKVAAQLQAPIAFGIWPEQVYMERAFNSHPAGELKQKWEEFRSLAADRLINVNNLTSNFEQDAESLIWAWYQIIMYGQRKGYNVSFLSLADTDTIFEWSDKFTLDEEYLMLILDIVEIQIILENLTIDAEILGNN